jgi:hypothetical protein
MMEKEFQYKSSIKLDCNADRTYIRLEIHAAGVFSKAKESYRLNYLRTCSQHLHRVAAQKSIQILVWSVELNPEHESIVHHITVRGVLYGTLPLPIARALRPPPGYWKIDLLARGLQKGWRVERILKASVEYQRLQRHDRNGRRLEEPLPAQLLMRAIQETDWRGLIGPCDKPWAYINTATQRIYARHYQETDEADRQEANSTLPQNQIDSGIQATGDDLVVENIRNVFRAAGCTKDMVDVLTAKEAEGKKWYELPEYLTRQTGALWDMRRVEAARGGLRRRKDKLRAAGVASSKWKPRQTDKSVYRERLPDGALWNGLSTYAHRFQGEELEILNEVLLHEWMKLFPKR